MPSLNTRQRDVGRWDTDAGHAHAASILTLTAYCSLPGGRWARKTQIMKQFLLQQPCYERAIFVCRLIPLSGWSEKLGRTRNAPQRPQRPDVMKRAACKTCQKSHSAPPFAGPTQQRTIFNVRLMRAFRVADARCVPIQSTSKCKTITLSDPLALASD